MLEIVNNQRKVKLDWKIFRDFAGQAIDSIAEAKEKSATVAFISDRKMRELNKRFRGKNTTTDVLSFPFQADEFERAENNLGDVVISVEQAGRQAVENGLTLEIEIKQLILHGILHLYGFDHETDDGEMNRREIDLREKLGI